MNSSRIARFAGCLGIAALALSTSSRALPPPPDPPDPCDCCVCAGCLAAGSTLQLMEGALQEFYPVVKAGSGAGDSRRATLELTLAYSSRHAVNESASAGNTALGYGWTHSYHIFLYTYQGNVFRRGPTGRITQFVRVPGSSPVRYLPDAGYFESLVRNADGTYTLTYPDGTSERFKNFPGCPYLFVSAVYQLVERQDRNGNKTTLTYDAVGRLLKVADFTGRAITFTYDARNRVRTITDPLGHTTQLTHASAGSQLTQITDPAGHTLTCQYDGQYRITRKTDKNGAVFVYTYGAGTRKAEQLNADGSRTPMVSLANPTDWVIDQALLARSFRTEYLPATVTNTDPRGNVWTYRYDKNGCLTEVRAPGATAATTYAYDPVTRKRAAVTDANGHTTRYEYDSRGNLTQTTDALGFVTRYSYEPLFNQMLTMTDPKGRVTTYEYDAHGNRTKETDPLLQEQTWTYDAQGNVLTDTDRRGHATTYTYDASSNRTKVTDSLGNFSTMTYDGAGNLLSRTDANGHTTTYEYDLLSRLTRQTDPLGRATNFAYDAIGDRSAVTDRNGHTTSFEYDLRRRPVKVTDALGHVTSMSYDATGNRVSVSDRNGNVTQYAYDAQNRCTQIMDPLADVTAMTYDAVGNMLTRTDPNGHVTTFTYDALNRRITTTDAQGYLTQVEYDAGGTGGCPTCGATPGTSLVTKVTDGNNKVTYYKYDALNRLRKEIRKQTDTADTVDADDAVRTYTYDANGNLVGLTDPVGNTTTYDYDALDRRMRGTNAAGDTATNAYDAVGNAITVTWPNGNIVAMSYDDCDRIVQVNDSIGRVVSYTYDHVGNRVSRTDGNNNTTNFGYDALNRLTEITDPLGRTSQRQYDAVGNLMAVTDREGRVTAHAYDAMNRVVTTTDALLGTTQFEYDRVGNQVKATDPNGHAMKFAYDALNRLVEERYPDAAPNTRSFTYDAVNLVSRTDQKGQTTQYSYTDLYLLSKRTYPAGPADNFTYDLAGRALRAERGGWIVSLSYDAANRVVQSEQNGQTVAFSYDIPGRTRVITYPGGRVITEHADPRERLARIDDGAVPSLTTYAYDLGDRISTRTDGNGVVASYAYNANDWVSSIEYRTGPTRVLGFASAFDREGNKTYEQALHDPARSEAYVHDALYRLVDFAVGTLVGSTIPAPTRRNAYAYDAYGNWNSVTRDGVVESRTHNAADEILTINGGAITYDDNGNLQQDDHYSYAYDEENRLDRVTRVSDGVVVGAYQYDAIGRRVQKATNAGGVARTTRYFYEGDRVIEEQDDLGVTQATYVHGNYVDEVVRMDRGGNAYYHHQNPIMSVGALTDAAGVPVERYAYDAFGTVSVFTGGGVAVPPNAWNTPHSAVGNPHLFTGRELDEEAGLYHYRARTYDAAKGRFLQRDPERDPEPRNLYAYVRNRPTRFVDPTGLADSNICWRQSTSVKVMGYDEFNFPFKESEPGFEQMVDLPPTKLGSLFDALGVAKSFYDAYHAAFDDHVKNAMDAARENAVEECNKFCAPFECPDSAACCVGEIGEGKFRGKTHDKRKDHYIDNAPSGYRKQTTDFQVAVEGVFPCKCKCERSWAQRAWDWYIDLW